MSAADRDYWRESEPSGPRLSFDLPPVTRILFFTLIGCFIAQALNEVYGRGHWMGYLALTQPGIARGWLWQLLTFQFLHGGIGHLVGNLMALWSFGGTVERILGRGRFALAYLGSGVAGGLLQAVLMSSFPQHFAPVVLGASAGIAGLFAIFALTHRDTTFLIFFILPVSAISLYYGFAGISAFFTLVPSTLGGFSAHAAHLGGLMLGTLWVRQGWHHNYQSLPGEQLLRRLGRRLRYGPDGPPPPPKKRTAAAAAAPRPAQRQAAGRHSPEGAFDLSAEVDPILDKIAEHGIQSLTLAEREKLDEARRKMTGK